MKRFFGILFGVSFLFLPLAFAFAQTAPAVSIQSLTPGSTITPGNEVSFAVVASGFGGSLSYSVSDSLSGSSVSNSDFNNAGVFTWIPVASDSGTHTLTITVSDQNNNSSSATQQITVQGPPTVSIQSLSPGTSVVVGHTINFTATASGFTNPAYAVSDSFSNSSLTSSAINSSGGFSWTPLSQDAGVHTVTVTVTDSQGDSATASQSITVNAAANLSIQSVSPSTSVSSGQTLTFASIPTGFNNPTYTVSDSFSGSSISNSNINSSGNFSWTPTANDSGSHTITVYASDSSGNSANTSITINANSVASITVTAPSPSSTVAPGTTVVFTAYAYGFTTPSFTVGDSFSGTSIGNGDINSSGNFSWTPTANDAGTHSITVTATDSYGHTASASAQLQVTGGLSQTLTSGLTQAQIQSILSLLQSFGADQSIINNVAATLGKQTTGVGDGFVFNNFLSVGSTGTDVTELQKHLTALGAYSGPVTGYFGSLTQAAVEQFQGTHGISQVGYVGPATRAALNQ